MTSHASDSLRLNMFFSLVFKKEISHCSRRALDRTKYLMSSEGFAYDSHLKAFDIFYVLNLKSYTYLVGLAPYLNNQANIKL